MSDERDTEEAPLNVALPPHEERIVRLDPQMASSMKSARRLNVVVRDVLNGWFEASPKNMATYLIALMKSGADIVPETRDAIAEALERGQYDNRLEEQNEGGFCKPRLSISGNRRDSARADGYVARCNQLDAAEALRQYKIESGEKGSSAIIKIGSKFDLDYESMRKATSLLNRFHREIANSKSETLRRWRERGEDGEVFTPDDEYHYAEARSIFIDIEIGKTLR